MACRGRRLIDVGLAEPLPLLNAQGTELRGLTCVNVGGPILGMLVTPAACRPRKGTPMPRILVPVDGSTHSDNAVRFAIALARRGGAEIHLINVQPMLPGDVLAFVPKASIDSFYAEGSDKALASARALLDEAKQPYITHVAVGPTGPAIVEYAAAHRCDQIVMGSRGHNAAVNLLLGSVATSVIAHAPQPITIVK